MFGDKQIHRQDAQYTLGFRSYNKNVHKDYIPLYQTLLDAFNQAASGKGVVRHANAKPFTQQPSMEIARMVGPGYALGQAMKKAQESIKLSQKSTDAAVAELYGAINYLAMEILRLKEEHREPIPTYDEILKANMEQYTPAVHGHPGQQTQESSDEEQAPELSIQEEK